MAEPSVSILSLPFGVTELRGPGSRVAATAASTSAYRSERSLSGQPSVVLWGPGGGAVVVLSGGDLRAVAARGAGDMSALEQAPAAIPGARTASSGALSVTLQGATGAYAHEALGSATHATTLVIAERRPGPLTSTPAPVPIEMTRIDAGPGAVFEDREARLVDLNHDGAPEILVVRSRRESGSSLVVVGRKAGVWAIVAETPPDGEPFRWLNPVGGVGAPPGVVMLVRRPHLDGSLQAWRLGEAGLELGSELRGYSNHAFGRTAQDLAAWVDRGSEPLLAIPTLDRNALALIAPGPPMVERSRISLPVRAATGIAVLGRGTAAHILVGLEDGRVADVRP